MTSLTILEIDIGGAANLSQFDGSIRRESKLRPHNPLKLLQRVLWKDIGRNTR